MQINIPIQPTTTFTLPIPAQALACASGQTGPYFFANTQNKSIDVYVRQGDQLVAKHSAPYTQFNWYDTTATVQDVCSMAVSAGGHKLYVLFGTKMPNGLYKAWVTYYTWDGTILKETEYSFPIPGLTGVELTNPSLGDVTSLDQTLIYIKDHGFTGISQYNMQLTDLLNIVYYRGYLIITYPIYFNTYPVAYTAVLVVSEKDASIRSASVLTGLSKWHEHNWPKPLAESVVIIDNMVIFRAFRAGLLPREWYGNTFDQYSRFIEFDPCLQGDVNAWRQLYTTSLYSWNDIISLQSSITAPNLLPDTAEYSGSFTASTGYTDTVVDSSNINYIGLKDLDIQVFSINYTVLEVLLHGVWVQYRNLDYQNLHPTEDTILQCRLRNPSQSIFIWNLLVETTEGLTLGTDATTITASNLTVTELAPQTMHNFFAKFAAGYLKPTMSLSYTPGI